MAEEVEIKLRVEAAEAARERILALGFVVRHGRELETNLVFDTAEGRMRQSGELLRLRRHGERTTLTYKGLGRAAKHKAREEVEVKVSDGAAFETILARLGYAPAFRYEKYRIEYERPGAGGIVTVDETPIGNFFEIEGEPDWIDATARELGFGESEYITRSYGALYAAHRERNPSAPRDMVFEAGGMTAALE